MVLVRSIPPQGLKYLNTHSVVGDLAGVELGPAGASKPSRDMKICSLSLLPGCSLLSAYNKDMASPTPAPTALSDGCCHPDGLFFSFV